MAVLGLALLTRPCIRSTSAGSRAWAGMTHEQVVAAVGGEDQLEIPVGLPPVLHAILLTCLSKNPADR